MIIGCKYEVVGELGRGGMGTVYRVRHLGLDTLFALKVLRASLAEDADLVARFHHEARIMAQLRHPSIVRVYDVVTEGVAPYFVMEFIPGRSLDQILRDEGPLPLPQALAIITRVGEALAYTHGYQPAVIHRDIKPSNILVEDETDRVVVTDFGIAKILDQQRTQVTRSGVFLGTVRYCAPEQLRGDRNLDGRVDIHALGMVTYEVISGRKFFAGMSDHEIIGKQLYDRGENIPAFERHVPMELRRLVTRAIAKDSSARYPTVDALLTDLNAISTSSTSRKNPSVWVWRLGYPTIALAALSVLVWAGTYLAANEDLIARLKDLLPEERNRSPRLTEIVPSQQRVTAGGGVAEFRVTAEDPDELDHDQLRYAWTLDGRPLAETTSHLSLTRLQVGAFQVEVVARDPRGAEVTHAWTVQVPKREAPVKPPLHVPKPEVPVMPPLEVVPAADKLTLNTCTKQEFSVKADPRHRGYGWWIDAKAQSEQGPRLVFSGDQAGTHDVRVSVSGDVGTQSHRWELTVTALAPSEKEVQQWLAAYEQALEQKDISKLRELGYLSSDDQANKLAEELQARGSYVVDIQNVRTEVQSSGARLGFDQVEQWQDAGTYSMVVDRSTHSETLVHGDCTRVVSR